MLNVVDEYALKYPKAPLSILLLGFAGDADPEPPSETVLRSSKYLYTFASIACFSIRIESPDSD